jgi:hypothetical protein
VALTDTYMGAWLSVTIYSMIPYTNTPEFSQQPGPPSQVTKMPSRYAELKQRKLDIENQILRIKTKYSYHHSIK